MEIKKYYTSNNWSIGSDGVQWALAEKSPKGKWSYKIFISTDKDILELYMRELDVPREDQLNLLSRLPCTFKEWEATNPTPDKNKRQGNVIEALNG